MTCTCKVGKVQIGLCYAKVTSGENTASFMCLRVLSLSILFPLLDRNVTKKIAVHFADKMGCIALALQIGVSQDLLAVIEGKADVHYVWEHCQELLWEWWKTQSSSAGAVLYNSLVAIRRKEIADNHAEVLLKDCKSSIASSYCLKEFLQNLPSAPVKLLQVLYNYAVSFHIYLTSCPERSIISSKLKIPSFHLHCCSLQIEVFIGSAVLKYLTIGCFHTLRKSDILFGIRNMWQ